MQICGEPASGLLREHDRALGGDMHDVSAVAVSHAEHHPGLKRLRQAELPVDHRTFKAHTQPAHQPVASRRGRGQVRLRGAGTAGVD